MVIYLYLVHLSDRKAHRFSRRRNKTKQLQSPLCKRHNETGLLRTRSRGGGGNGTARIADGGAQFDPPAPASPFPGLRISLAALLDPTFTRGLRNCSDAALAQLLFPTRASKLPPLKLPCKSEGVWEERASSRAQTDHTHPASLCHRFFASWRLPAAGRKTFFGSPATTRGNEKRTRQEVASSPPQEKGTFRAKAARKGRCAGSLPRCRPLPSSVVLAETLAALQSLGYYPANLLADVVHHTPS